MHGEIIAAAVLATGVISGSETLFKLTFDRGPKTEPAGLAVTAFGNPEYKDGTMVLDGKGSYIKIANPESINRTESQSFTLVFSYKPEETGKKDGTYIKLFSRGNLPTPYWNVSEHLRCGTPAFKAGYNLNGKYKGLYNKLAAITPSLERWHKVGIIRNATLRRISFYHDGRLIQEFDDELPELFDNRGMDIYIGGAPNEGSFKGRIGTVTIMDGIHPATAAAPAGVQDKMEKERLVTIDPELRKTWKTLKDTGLNMVPSPKRLKLTGSPFPFIPGEWKLTRLSKEDEAGLLEFNRRLAETGLQPLSGNGSKHEIKAGLCNDLKIFCANEQKPPRQGYVIKFSGNPDAMKIYLVGTDPDGLRYAWLTVGSLLRENGMMQPADVEDWPDFEKRFAYTVFSTGNGRKIVDEAFRAKTNFIALGGAYDKKAWLAHNREEMRRLTDYARERGIIVLVGSMTTLKDFPENMKIPEGYSELYYPWTTEKGLFGYKKGGCSWSREDLMHSRAEEYASIFFDYGYSVLNLHSTDHGGFENPANWNLRSEECRRRWKDSERAEADANMTMIFYEELKKKNPDLWLYFTQYPYVTTRDGRTLEYYRKLSKILKERSDDNISLCMREASRGELEEVMKSFATKNVVFAYYPWDMFCYPFVTQTGRYAATFHFGPESKVQLYLGTPFGHFRNVSKWIAAEYMWNAYAPGAAYLPVNKYDYSVIFGETPIIENELIPRICALLYGEKAAKKLAWCFTLKMSDEIPGYPNGVLPAAMDKEKYFARMAEDSRKAAALVNEAEPLAFPEAKTAVGELKTFFRRSELLAEARLCEIRARKYLDDGKMEAAKAEAAKGIAILEDSATHWRNRHKMLQNDLNIANMIGLRLKLNEYLKNVTEKPIRVAFYAYSGTGGIKDSIGTLPRAFHDVKGITVSTVSNLTKTELEKIDVLIFNATADLGDCTEDAAKNIADFVRKDGKGVIFTHNALGRRKGTFSSPFFPEIFKKFDGTSCQNKLKIVDTSIFGKDFLPHSEYVHRYYDHCYGTPGPAGKTIMTDVGGHAVMVIGNVGKGRVVYTGEIFGQDRSERMVDPEFEEWKMLFNLIRWASGK